MRLESLGKIFIVVLSFVPFKSLAQEEIDTMTIKGELAFVHERDQKTRTSGDSAEFMFYIDSCNLAYVESLIKKYGWPGISFVGAIGNFTVWLVIQHADLQTQEKYFPLMKESVGKGESRAKDLALLEDRILMRQEKKQIYGSQITFNKITGAQEFWPIEDEQNVNARRSEVGLEPIEDYAKHFDIEYKLEKD